MPHKLTQPKVLKKTLKQKVTTVKMIAKMTKKKKEEDYKMMKPKMMTKILLKKMI